MLKKKPVKKLVKAKKGTSVKKGCPRGQCGTPPNCYDCPSSTRVSTSGSKKTIPSVPTKIKSKNTDPNVKYKTSNNWADEYSVDTTGLSSGNNLFPYRRSNGTKGAFTRGEVKTILKNIKSGDLIKNKKGGSVKAKKK